MQSYAQTCEQFSNLHGGLGLDFAFVCDFFGLAFSIIDSLQHASCFRL